MSEDRYIVHIHSALIFDAVVIRAEIDEQMSNLFRADVYIKTMEQIDTEKLLNTASKFQKSFKFQMNIKLISNDFKQISKKKKFKFQIRFQNF